MFSFKMRFVWQALARYIYEGYDAPIAERNITLSYSILVVLFYCSDRNQWLSQHSCHIVSKMSLHPKQHKHVCWPEPVCTRWEYPLMCIIRAILYVIHIVTSVWNEATARIGSSNNSLPLPHVTCSCTVLSISKKWNRSQ